VVISGLVINIRTRTPYYVPYSVGMYDMNKNDDYHAAQVTCN